MVAQRVIGLMGYARSGKDTVARELARQLGARRAAFADGVRSLAYEINPIVGMDPIYDTHLRLREVVDSEGWEKAKDRMLVRTALQDIGQALKRENGDYYWVDQAMRKLATAGEDVVVFSDVRFPEEADYMDITVRVTRPGVGAVNNHLSETALDGYHPSFVLTNDGDKDTIPGKVRDLIDRMEEKGFLSR